jgi:hypothetical protein
MTQDNGGFNLKKGFVSTLLKITVMPVMALLRVQQNMFSPFLKSHASLWTTD